MQLWTILAVFAQIAVVFGFRVRRASIKDYACMKRPSLDFCSNGGAFGPDAGRVGGSRSNRVGPSRPRGPAPRRGGGSGRIRPSEIEPFPFGSGIDTFGGNSNRRKYTGEFGRPSSTISESLGLAGPVAKWDCLGVGVPGVGPIGVNSGVGVGAPGIGGFGGGGPGLLGLGNGGLFGIGSGVGVSTPIGPIGVNSGLGIGK
uniref:Glycine-rich protein n=1 Tax=Panagrolaimus sp. JU765 TaxID=591449 RepID=A0AC34Q6V0_9BILA